MQAKVTEQGVVIPKEWLKGSETVEIFREADRIVLIPNVKTDPIWELGTKPVTCGVKDASENLDTYLSDSI